VSLLIVYVNTVTDYYNNDVAFGLHRQGEILNYYGICTAIVGSAAIPSSRESSVAALGTGTDDEICIKLWTGNVNG